MARNANLTGSFGEGLAVVGVSKAGDAVKGFGAGTEGFGTGAKGLVRQLPITRRRSFLAAFAALSVSCEGVRAQVRSASEGLPIMHLFLLW